MKRKISIITIMCLVVALCPTTVKAVPKLKLSDKNISVQVGKTKVLKVKNTRQKARWSIKSGKKNIKLKAKKRTSVKIYGVKKGTAKVQCKLGKKKLVCKVKVLQAKNVANENANPTLETPRGTHIPTENRLMAEPLKLDESATKEEDGSRIIHPYGNDIHYFFGSSIRRSDIEQITFTDSNVAPQNVIGTMDLSEKQNGSVMAWYIDSDRNGAYEVTIGQEGGVVANPNSSYLFSDIAKGETKKKIILRGMKHFYTDEVVDMSKMFLRFGMNGNKAWGLNLGDYFNTSKVTNMSQMFAYMGAYNTSIQGVHLFLGKSFNGTHIQECQTPFVNCDAYIYVPSTAMKEWIINVQMPGWANDGRITVD